MINSVGVLGPLLFVPITVVVVVEVWSVFTLNWIGLSLRRCCGANAVIRLVELKARDDAKAMMICVNFRNMIVWGWIDFVL